MMTDEEIRAQSHISNAHKNIANALNIIEAAQQELYWAFDDMPDWNDDIKYQIQEAAEKLGYALATLTNWNDYDSNDAVNNN